MKIQHIASATVIIESNGFRVLCDPWLIDGIYYGSWYRYPKLIVDWDLINSVDYIYISHIHPDHADKRTLELINKDIPVIIHRYSTPYLKNFIERIGFTVIELPNGGTHDISADFKIEILAADNCDPEVCGKHFGCAVVESNMGSTQIDSLAVFSDNDHTILNVNDCPFELAASTVDRVIKKYKHIDMLLVGYSGASPYPQCYKLDDVENEATKKKFICWDRTVKYILRCRPDHYMPFAGTYVLGGKLSKLNKYRGVPSLEETRDYLENILPEYNCVLLNYYGEFDLHNPTDTYQEISPEAEAEYIEEELSHIKMDYEAELPVTADKIWMMVHRAYERMERHRKGIGFESDTMALIKVYDKYIGVSFDGSGVFIVYNDRMPKKYVKYSLHENLLYNILQGPRHAHWNNAEIGSHIQFERNPNVFERGLHHVMNFFHA